MHPVRFGKIHIISPEKLTEIRQTAIKTAVADKNPAALTYAEPLAALLKDDAVKTPGQFRAEMLFDKRRVIFTNTDTNDLAAFNQFVESCRLDVMKRDEREGVDVSSWANEFITIRSEEGQRLNFVE